MPTAGLLPVLAQLGVLEGDLIGSKGFIFNPFFSGPGGDLLPDADDDWGDRVARMVVGDGPAALCGRGGGGRGGCVVEVDGGGVLEGNPLDFKCFISNSLFSGPGGELLAVADGCWGDRVARMVGEGGLAALCGLGGSG